MGFGVRGLRFEVWGVRFGGWGVVFCVQRFGSMGFPACLPFRPPTLFICKVVKRRHFSVNFQQNAYLGLETWSDASVSRAAFSLSSSVFCERANFGDSSFIKRLVLASAALRKDAIWRQTVLVKRRAFIYMHHMVTWWTCP